MNFLGMEYFLVIVEEGSFSRAAKKMFVSQQSLSEHIKKLEEELGSALLKRGQSLELTAAGEVFLRGSKEILGARNRMFQEIAHVTKNQRTKITIAIATFDTPPFLPSLLTQYALIYPQYEAVVVKRQVSDISRNMAGVDLYFSWLPLDDALAHIPIIEDDPIVVMIHEQLLLSVYGKRWPKLEQSLLTTEDLSLLTKLPFLMLYDKNGMLSKDLDLIFSSYGFTPIVGFQSENEDLNFEMCMNGAGGFLAPLNFCRRKLESKSIKPEEIRIHMFKIKTPNLQSMLALSHKKGKKLNPAEKAFIDLTRNFLSSSCDV